MGIANATELSKKIQNRGTRGISNPNEIRPSEYKAPISIASRKKMKHRAKVSLREKILIIHRVVNQLHPQKEEAKEFRVSEQLVSFFCVKARKNPKFLDRLSA